MNETENQMNQLIALSKAIVDFHSQYGLAGISYHIENLADLLDTLSVNQT